MIDAGINPPDHRYNLLGYGSTQSLYREIGCGLIQGQVAQTGAPYDSYVTQDFGCAVTSQAILTGVVYADTAGTGVYQAGEGIPGVTVTVTGPSNNAASATTMTAGGYAFTILTPGTYTVSMSGGPFATPVSVQVVIANDNVKVDGVSGSGLIVR